MRKTRLNSFIRGLLTARNVPIPVQETGRQKWRNSKHQIHLRHHWSERKHYYGGRFRTLPMDAKSDIYFLSFFRRCRNPLPPLLPQTTPERFGEFTEHHDPMRRRRVKWFALEVAERRMEISQLRSGWWLAA